MCNRNSFSFSLVEVLFIVSDLNYHNQAPAPLSTFIPLYEGGEIVPQKDSYLFLTLAAAPDIHWFLDGSGVDFTDFRTITPYLKQETQQRCGVTRQTLAKKTWWRNLSELRPQLHDGFNVPLDPQETLNFLDLLHKENNYAYANTIVNVYAFVAAGCYRYGNFSKLLSEIRKSVAGEDSIVSSALKWLLDHNYIKRLIKGYKTGGGFAVASVYTLNVRPLSELGRYMMEKWHQDEFYDEPINVTR